MEFVGITPSVQVDALPDWFCFGECAQINLIGNLYTEIGPSVHFDCSLSEGEMGVEYRFDSTQT